MPPLQVPYAALSQKLVSSDKSHSDSLTASFGGNPVIVAYVCVFSFSKSNGQYLIIQEACALEKTKCTVTFFVYVRICVFSYDIVQSECSGCAQLHTNMHNR